MKTKILKIIIVKILVGIPSISYSQNIETKKIDFSKCKPTMPNPKHFCGDVGSKSLYKGDDANFAYVFEKVMFESACADVENMSEKELAQKLSVWWDLYKDKLLCDSLEFNVPNGSVFKQAINGKITAFVDDAIYYKFDLNFVDKADDRTVLDYTRDEIKKHSETSEIRKVLEGYYNKLRNAGAKHKSEL